MIAGRILTLDRAALRRYGGQWVDWYVEFGRPGLLPVTGSPIRLIQNGAFHETVPHR